MDMTKYYQQYMAAEKSAFMATPALYRSSDTFALKADEFESSANVSFQQAVNEVDILKLGDTLAYPSEMLKGKIMNILMSDIMIDDPVVKQAYQKDKEARVKKAIEGYNKQLESQLKMMAKMKAVVNHERAKGEQLQRLYGSEIGASKETSEDKSSSMAEIENAYLVGPDDIALA
ncbi:MAG: hypothetical protein LW817_02260 [Candidatus Caenarcaniphilales bacterium]|jgi:hypothetical protein|nr:hypothetical protein [Candidatus Caenarcaniphilales bacterium]